MVLQILSPWFAVITSSSSFFSSFFFSIFFFNVLCFFFYIFRASPYYIFLYPFCFLLNVHLLFRLVDIRAHCSPIYFVYISFSRSHARSLSHTHTYTRARYSLRNERNTRVLKTHMISCSYSLSLFLSFKVVGTARPRTCLFVYTYIHNYERAIADRKKEKNDAREIFEFAVLCRNNEENEETERKSKRNEVRISRGCAR